jgi:Protein of unknown function (DUF2490)
MRFPLFCFLLILFPKALSAQTTHQQTYWTRLFLRCRASEKWSVQFEADNRRVINPDKPLQFISHLHVHRRLGERFEASLGFTFSAVWQNGRVLPEYRPFQEFYVFHRPAGAWRFSHRLRTEQRWLGLAGGTGFRFRWRFRYMPRVDCQLSKKWLLRANTELFYHHDDFDQGRLYGGAQCRVSKHVSLELGYLKLIQKRASDAYFDRDNLRFTGYFDF